MAMWLFGSSAFCRSPASSLWPLVLYEVDRREKSSLATAERSLADIEQRIQMLSNQFHILNNQLTAQVMATERQVQALNREVQALRDQHELRLKELEDSLRVRRVQPGPVPR